MLRRKYNWRTRLKPYKQYQRLEEQNVPSRLRVDFNKAIAAARGLLERERTGAEDRDACQQGDGFVGVGSGCGGSLCPPANWKVGDNVEALNQNGQLSEKQWYPCRIASIHSDGIYQVEWDDGDEKDTYKNAGLIRAREGCKHIQKAAETSPSALLTDQAAAVVDGQRADQTSRKRVRESESFGECDEHEFDVGLRRGAPADSAAAAAGKLNEEVMHPGPLAFRASIRPRIKESMPLIPGNLFSDSDQRSCLQKVLGPTCPCSLWMLQSASSACF